MTYLKLSLLSFSLAALMLGCGTESDEPPLVPEIESMQINQEDNNYSLYSLQHTLKLYVDINYTDGSIATAINEVSWKALKDTNVSEDILVHNGDVIALKNSGEANITISFRDKLSSEEPRLVTLIPLNKITNFVHDLNLLELNTTVDINATTGESIQLYANGKFIDDKIVLAISSNIAWTSSNTSIATISTTGLINVIASGVTEVNASVFGDINGSIDLNITMQ